MPTRWIQVETTVVLPVTVDGKSRGEIVVDRSATEAQVKEAGLRLDSVARIVEGREVIRVVFIPGKILNLVTRPVSAKSHGQ